MIKVCSRYDIGGTPYRFKDVDTGTTNGSAPFFCLLDGIFYKLPPGFYYRGKRQIITQSSNTIIHANGLQILRSRHRDIRRLKRTHAPSTFGYRMWTSSWILMEVLKNQGLSSGLNVMEVGCGWGVAGIYCAKNHAANVTCVDIDSEVFPYLDLHSQLNDVKVSTLCMGFDQLGPRQLKGMDVLIGADICFWDEMVDSLRALILRAMQSEVRLVVIADPGRITFEALEEYFVKNHQGQGAARTIERPFQVEGRTLVVGSLIGGRSREHKS